MLKLANLYDGELKNLVAEASIDPRYMYYFTQPTGGYFEFGQDENTVWKHRFVSLDKDGNIIGYISYNIDAFARNANNFGLISFDIGNIDFIRDVYSAVADIFEKYRMNRLGWAAVEDNPATPSYRRICRRMGGIECGRERQVVQLMDGKLHDSVFFEVLAEDYFKSKAHKRYAKKIGAAK